MSCWSGSYRRAAEGWSRRHRGRSTTRCPCARTARIGSGRGSRRMGRPREGHRQLLAAWLGPDARGRGLGKEMRQAVLHLAFEGLGAREARSAAFVDNHASNRVSEAVGYTPNGVCWETRRGDAAELRRRRLTHERWSQRRRDDIEFVGGTDDG